MLHIKLWSGHVWTFLKLEPSEPTGVVQSFILTYGQGILEPYQGVTQLSHNVKLLFLCGNKHQNAHVTSLGPNKQQVGIIRKLKAVHAEA